MILFFTIVIRLSVRQLLGGIWPIKAAMESAISLKVLAIQGKVVYSMAAHRTTRL